MMEDDGLPLAPVFVENFGAVSCHDRRHGAWSYFESRRMESAGGLAAPAVGLRSLFIHLETFEEFHVARVTPNRDFGRTARASRTGIAAPFLRELIAGLILVLHASRKALAVHRVELGGCPAARSRVQVRHRGGLRELDRGQKDVRQHCSLSITG